MQAVWINRQRLLRRLSAAARCFQIELISCTSSTNSDLLQRLRQHPTQRPVFRLAYRQSAGRGRRNQPWLSWPGASLTFSLACVLPRPPQALSGLSLATGVAILQGLRHAGLDPQKRLSLKWPNDILLDARKLAGILIETAWQQKQSSAVVIGVGMNLCRHPGLQPRLCGATEESLPRSSLDNLLGSELLLSEQILPNLFNSLVAMISQFAETGFAPFHAAWQSMHFFQQQPVRLVQTGGYGLEGIVAGVDEQGYLLLDTPTGQHRIHSGELCSLRPIHPQGVKTVGSALAKVCGQSRL